MGHRTKIDVAVDGKDELVIRAKLGYDNWLIIEKLKKALDRFTEHWESFDRPRDNALMMLDCIASFADDGVGFYSDFGKDESMDVHVRINILTNEGGSIHIVYLPDNGDEFSGSFDEFKNGWEDTGE